MSLLAGLAGGLVDSVVGGLFNANAARENRQFQERMSSTAYQRAAKDAEAAGLNRVIALGSPASTPAGSVAAPIDGPIGKGAQINSARAQADLMKMQLATESERKDNVEEDTILKIRQQYAASSQVDVNFSQAKLNEQNAKTAAALERKYNVEADAQALDAAIGTSGVGLLNSLINAAKIPGVKIPGRRGSRGNSAKSVE